MDFHILKCSLHLPVLTTAKEEVRYTTRETSAIILAEVMAPETRVVVSDRFRMSFRCKDSGVSKLEWDVKGMRMFGL